jgi:hypothetical protein
MSRVDRRAAVDKRIPCYTKQLFQPCDPSAALQTVVKSASTHSSTCFCIKSQCSRVSKAASSSVTLITGRTLLLGSLTQPSITVHPPSQLSPLIALLLHQTHSQDLAIQLTIHSAADGSATDARLQNLADHLNRLPNLDRLQVADLQPFRRSSTNPALPLSSLSVAHAAIDNSSRALRHAVEESGDGASVDGAEFVAVFWREFDAEGGDTGCAVGVGDAGEDFDGSVDGGVKVVGWGEDEVGLAVGFEAGHELWVGALRGVGGGWG